MSAPEWVRRRLASAVYDVGDAHPEVVGCAVAEEFLRCIEERGLRVVDLKYDDGLEYGGVKRRDIAQSWARSLPPFAELLGEKP